MSRSSKRSLAETPQGVAPKAGLFVLSIVSLRVGGGKSAYLATDRQIYSRRVKKLEGPLQKATLVPVESTSENKISDHTCCGRE